MLKKHEMHLHFIGIGGIGMSGIAEVLLNQGYNVSGSDLVESEATRRLSPLGAKIKIGHRKENVLGAQVIVTSSAVKPSNPELIEAKRLRIPVIPRAEMLGELMRGKIGIGVSGTHGKTTTTSMLATILSAAESDPTIVIGGRVDSLGGNAKLGQGRYVVAEADESDGSFFHLPTTYAVVTNIDDDHLDHYGSLQAIENAFVDFVGQIPFYGLAAVCIEDAGVRRCMERWTKPVVTYGFSSEADLFADSIETKGLGSHWCVHFRKPLAVEHQRLGEIELKVSGTHNILNALAAIAVSLELEIPFEVIKKGLAEFSGVKRRFEILWSDPKRRRVIVDDYGHHPTEIAATLKAARNYWPGRIIAVFQPHRFTRTLNCRPGFARAFENADVLYLTDIYSAGEEPIPGVDASALREWIADGGSSPREIQYLGGLDRARLKVLSEFKDGDLVICMGAGSITKFASELARDHSH